ncbi:class I SAM-dependent methyltransferase [Patescibacteria group bacterium]
MNSKVQLIGEFDHPTRGKRYRQAIEEMPLARKNEVSLMLRKINAVAGEKIVDFGCGNGILTYLLAEVVGSNGVIYALDNSKEVLIKLLEDIKSKNIQTKKLESEIIPLEDNSVDAVVTLANIHHIPNKENIFKEFSRILRKGGRLIISDVADKTQVQRYFDGPIDKFCSTGHKHKFLNKSQAKELCFKSGLTVQDWKIEDVPWEFYNEEDAKKFLHTIHDITCSPEQFIKKAKEYLGYFHQNGKFLLNWKLFYLIATK